MICVDWIELSQYSISIKPGSWYYGLYASVCPSNASNQTIVWSSSNPSVASVGYLDGYIHANGTGTARIIAHATDGSGVTSSCTVQVTDTVKISSITFDQTSYAVEKDYSIYIVANICPPTASNTTLSWSSSDESVARVSDGTVCGIGAGNATITARATDGSGVSASCNVLVTDNKLVTSIAVSPKNLTINEGASTYFHARILPDDADNKDVIWRSSDPSVATITEIGALFTAIKAGTTIITAMAQDGSGVSGCVLVTVVPFVYVESVTVNPTEKTMTEGDSDYLTVIVCPSNATVRSVCWKSSNEEVAMVNGGMVCAIGEGQATITATAIDGSEVFGTALITVEPPILVESIILNHNSKEMYKGFELQLIAEILPSDAANKRIEWISEDSCIASVSDNGLVIAQGVGTTNIIARATDGSEKYGCCQIKVEPAQVSVDPKTEVLKPGEMTNLVAEIYPSQIAELVEIKWRSSNPNIASVDEETGFVTAKKEGTAIITATEESGKNSDSCTIVVDDRDRVRITGDGEYFDICFEDDNNLTWQNIGCDMSLAEKRSGYPLNKGINYDLLFDHEKRYVNNIENEYSIKQIAFIYRFDPLGIEFYMKDYASKKFNNIESILHYKDNVYKEIFGTPPDGNFYFTIEDGDVRYGEYTPNTDRTKIYSNAEVLFGSHVIHDFDLKNFIYKIITSIFGESESISAIQTGAQVYQSLFFAGSIVGTYSDLAISYIEDKAEEKIADNVVSLIKEKITEELKEKAIKSIHWVINAIFILTNAFLDSVSITTLNDVLNDAKIYEKIQNQDDYCVFFLKLRVKLCPLRKWLKFAHIINREKSTGISNWRSRESFIKIIYFKYGTEDCKSHISSLRPWLVGRVVHPLQFVSVYTASSVLYNCFSMCISLLSLSTCLTLPNKFSNLYPPTRVPSCCFP